MAGPGLAIYYHEALAAAAGVLAKLVDQTYQLLQELVEHMAIHSVIYSSQLPTVASGYLPG